MNNIFKPLILTQQALDKALVEAIDGEFVELIEELLQQGANPNYMPDDYGGSLLSRLLGWSQLQDIEKAATLLLSHHGNPNIDMPRHGSVLKQIRDSKETLKNNIVAKTLIFNDEESRERINYLTVFEQLLLKHGATPLVYLHGKVNNPFFRRGTKNPELIKDLLFYYSIVEQPSPTQLRKQLNLKGFSFADTYNLYANAQTGQKIHDIPEERLWNYHRFGTSTTILPDGGIVFIGGEHEDYYDPDFCIFNDVLAIDKSGKMHLFFYPKFVFKPTDFHTATYFNNEIIIIGNLGYQPDRKEEETQVYRLRLSDYSIEEVTTYGQNPKWIFKHFAFEKEGKIIVWGGKINSNNKLIDNDAIFSLDLKTCIWENHGDA